MSIRKNFISANDSFDEALFGYLSKAKKLSTFLNDEKKEFKSNEYSYRIINHWEQEGLIDDNRPNGKGWRKYSILDGVWMNCISKLRSFGLPLEKIREVKKHLFPAKNKKDNILFELNVAIAIGQKRATCLLVFSNGEALALTEEEYFRSLSFKSIEDDYIKISINSILQKMFPKLDLKPKKNHPVLANTDELELLLMVRTGNYDTITIKSNKGKIERLEATEKVANEKRIMDILAEGKYQDIEVKQADGKVVSIKRTIKKKVK